MSRTIPFLLALFLVCTAVPQDVKHSSAQTKLTAIVDSGTVLYLSDGSAWEIRRENRAKAAAWPKGEVIATYQANDREFPYRLVLRPGRDDGDVISANRLVRVYSAARPLDRASMHFSLVSGNR